MTPSDWNHLWRPIAYLDKTTSEIENRLTDCRRQGSTFPRERPGKSAQSLWAFIVINELANMRHLLGVEHVLMCRDKAPHSCNILNLVVHEC
jgi:hypothetical protein